MLFIRGATNRIACTTGPRFGCAARTSLALRRAALSAVTANRPLPCSQPVNRNSRSPIVIRCSSGESFKLIRRQSMPWLEANSVSTAARWRPARCTPPGASSSGKRPMSTGKVSQVLRTIASRDVSQRQGRPARPLNFQWARSRASRRARFLSNVSKVARLRGLVIWECRRSAGSVFFGLKGVFF